MTWDKKTPLYFLFPGQGSQYVGMDKAAKDILSANEYNAFWDEVHEALQFSLHKMITEGPLDQLTLTANAQPAILATSLLHLKALQSLYPYLTPHKVLGHSLGEYSALVASGALTLSQGLKLTRLRGELMQSAVPPGVGSMIAILGVTSNELGLCCKEVTQENAQVSMANFNTEQQIVISGHKQACSKVVALLEEKMASKLIPRFRHMTLSVSAPFHSPLMEPVKNGLEIPLSKIPMRQASPAIISNVTAKEAQDPQEFKELLLAQITGCVRWFESIQSLDPHGCYLEIGPGQVLSGIMKKIHPESLILHTDQDMRLLKTTL
jgi:[acyl-carrier-protein] S-malonyltransferase